MCYISNFKMQQLFFLLEQSLCFFQLVDFQFQVFVALLDFSQSLQGTQIYLHFQCHLLLLVYLLISFSSCYYFMIYLLYFGSKSFFLDLKPSYLIFCLNQALLILIVNFFQRILIVSLHFCMLFLKFTKCFNELILFNQHFLND